MVREIKRTSELCPHCGTERVWEWLYVDGKFTPPGVITKDCRCGTEAQKRATKMLHSIFKEAK